MNKILLRLILLAAISLHGCRHRVRTGQRKRQWAMAEGMTSSLIVIIVMTADETRIGNAASS